jgi:hypothetical protein
MRDVREKKFLKMALEQSNSIYPSQESYGMQITLLIQPVNDKFGVPYQM